MAEQLQSYRSNNSMIQGFEKFFKIQRADSNAILNDIYRIRYKVYCQEFGYDLPNHQGLERDEFDRYSSHCLLSHKQSGEKVGCIRVISLPENTSGMELPFITHCSGSLYPEHTDTHSTKPNDVCEISRVAVVSEFRRRPGEETSKEGLATELRPIDKDTTLHRRFPFIAPSLYLAAGALFLSSKKTEIFVATEPKLIKNLSTMGIRFNQVSDVTDYHGLRAVYQFTRQSLLEDIQAMPETLHEFFNFIEKQVT